MLLITYGGREITLLVPCPISSQYITTLSVHVPLHTRACRSVPVCMYGVRFLKIGALWIWAQSG